MCSKDYLLYLFHSLDGSTDDDIDLRFVLHDLPGPNRALLLVVYTTARVLASQAEAIVCTAKHGHIDLSKV